MDVNAMPGLVLDESENKEKDSHGDVNAMQTGNGCFFCKKTGHQKKYCRKYEEWKKKNPNWMMESINQSLLLLWKIRTYFAGMQRREAE